MTLGLPGPDAEMLDVLVWHVFTTAPKPGALDDLGHPVSSTQALLDSIAADPDMAIDCLDILGPDERKELLVGFNAVHLAPSQLMHPGQTIHGMLEHWAAATPEAPAALYEVTLALRIFKPSLLVQVIAQHVAIGRQ